MKTKIGYATLSVSNDNDYISALREQFGSVRIMDLDEKINRQMRDLKVLIIQDDENRFFETVCRLVIEAKQDSTLLIWFISSNLVQIHYDIYPKMGVSGLIDSSFSPENLSLLLQNVFLSVEGKGTQLSNHEDLPISLIPNQLSINIEGHHVMLTKLEYFLIEILYNQKGNVVTYEEIAKILWSNDPKGKGNNVKIANLIFNLRYKLALNGVEKRYIRTIRSKGYMLLNGGTI